MSLDYSTLFNLDLVSYPLSLLTCDIGGTDVEFNNSNQTITINVNQLVENNNTLNMSI